MTGLLAGIIKSRPESLSHFTVRDIYNVLQVRTYSLTHSLTYSSRSVRPVWADTRTWRSGVETGAAGRPLARRIERYSSTRSAQHHWSTAAYSCYAVRSGREHLQKLADEVTEEAMKQVRDRCAHRAGVPPFLPPQATHE
jgi:hypothetical protein